MYVKGKGGYDVLIRVVADGGKTEAADVRLRVTGADRVMLLMSVKDWRSVAARRASSSETVRALISQNYLLEARDALREWECEDPISKLSGDYILTEAGLYSALGNDERAKQMLAAYCTSVDVTSHLPAAMTALLDAMRRTQTSTAEMRAICNDIIRRLPYHPVAREARGALAALADGKGNTP